MHFRSDMIPTPKRHWKAASCKDLDSTLKKQSNTDLDSFGKLASELESLGNLNDDQNQSKNAL